MKKDCVLKRDVEYSVHKIRTHKMIIYVKVTCKWPFT